MESRPPEVTANRSLPKKLWKHSFFFFPVLVAAAGILAATLDGELLFRLLPGRSSPAESSGCDRNPPDVSRIRPLLKNGDVILRSGIGIWSDAFRARNTHDKRFSHVGIVLIGPDGACRVIQAEGDDITGRGKVFPDTLEHFVGQSTDIGISRLHASDPDALAEAAATFAGRPFDWKFDTDDDSAIYCTELVDLTLRKLDPGFRLPRDKDGIILPEACLLPEYFMEIEIPAEQESLHGN